MSISFEERKQAILRELGAASRVKVRELAMKLRVSDETIRRDLAVMERTGFLRRVYGGAVAPSPTGFEPPYAMRQTVMAEEKRKIGLCASRLIRSGDTIVIDVGTTMLELARHISGLERLTILTNSVAAALQLMESLAAKRFSGKVFLLGGELNVEQQSLSGAACEQMMDQFRVDKAFISAGGVTPDHGVSDYHLNEVGVSRRFVEAAQEVYVLADSTKIGKNAFARIMPLERADAVVSCGLPPKSWIPFLKQHGIRWISADTAETSTDLQGDESTCRTNRN